MPSRFMSVNEAANQLIAILDNKIQDGHKDLGLLHQILLRKYNNHNYNST